MKRTLFFIFVFTVLIANLVMAKDNPPIMLEGNLGLGGCQGIAVELILSSVLG
jgi:hypothetical protein